MDRKARRDRKAPPGLGLERPGFALSTIDSADSVGSAVSATVGADGLGLIAYHTSSSWLKVAHCSNLACTAATRGIISPFSNGQFASITVGSDGLGLISHRDPAAEELKIAHCSNVACSAATFATLDSVGDVGGFTSITVGADGLADQLRGLHDLRPQGRPLLERRLHCRDDADDRHAPAASTPRSRRAPTDWAHQLSRHDDLRPQGRRVAITDEPKSVGARRDRGVLAAGAVERLRRRGGAGDVRAARDLEVEGREVLVADQAQARRRRR